MNYHLIPSPLLVLTTLTCYKAMLQCTVAIRKRSYHGTTVQLVQPNHHLQLGVSTSTINCSPEAFPESFYLPTSASNVMAPSTPHSVSSHLHECPLPVCTVTYLVNDMEASTSFQSCCSTPMGSVKFPRTLEANVSSSVIDKCSSSTTTSTVGYTKNTSNFSQTYTPTATISATTENARTEDHSNVQPVSTDAPSPRSIVIGRSRGRHSPASSPHKLGKRGPKR